MLRRFPHLLSLCLLALAACAAPVRAQSSQDPVYVFHTNLGDIAVQLFPDVAPQTVTNFLGYVHAGAYAGSIVHRSVPGFIFQGGAYQVQNNGLVATPTSPPVANEFHLSNVRGTLSMAKLGGDPNSATSQWFFNEADANAANLDNQNGGFTVFGRVVDAAGLAVMDRIAAVPVPSPPALSPPLDQAPLMNYQPGVPVTPSQFVQVTSITPAWAAVSLSASAGGTRLLWNRSDGGADIWALGAGGIRAGSSGLLGPYAGWTTQASADGPDGRTRVLWDNADGHMSLWSLDSASGQFTQHTFDPYAGWTALGVSVAKDNTTHILWDNADGRLSLWNYSTATGAFTQNSYGPYPGWSAKAIADGPDGKTRVLWDNADGRMSLWSLDNGAAQFTQHTFGPYAGWTASAVSTAADGTTHVLWNNADGRASLWNYSTTDGTFTQNAFGPYPGWSAKAIADGADGGLRVLWDNAAGPVSVWDLDNVSGRFTQQTYGGYPGWAAPAGSTGP